MKDCFIALQKHSVARNHLNINPHHIANISKMVDDL